MKTKTCPLCHGSMELRDRSALKRFIGFGLIYFSLFSAIYSLPSFRPALLAGTALTLAAGWYVCRHSFRWWCRNCRHAVHISAGECNQPEP